MVEELGEGVTSLKVGDRIAYGVGALGAYAQVRNLPANRITKLPAGISDETAAGMMLKGMTVRYLLRATYKVQPGETILLHAAAGGVGLILSQWAKALGVTVIGTVGSDEKVEIARDHGCDHVINSSTENIVARVKEITGGKGVPVVYDGVGQSTLMTSLDCLKPRGLLVSFGNASGPVKALRPRPAGRARLALCHAAHADDLHRHRRGPEGNRRRSGGDGQVGKVKIPVNQRYALADAVQAHRDLESRGTTGTTILLP